MSTIRRILLQSNSGLSSAARLGHQRAAPRKLALNRGASSSSSVPSLLMMQRFAVVRALSSSSAASPPGAAAAKAKPEGELAKGSPKFAQDLEQKTVDEIKDLHVETLDDEFDDEGPLSWVNPETGEKGGPRGALRKAEPTRFGDWELNGRVSDF
eukprot:CAMPEP_0181291178 /NCGR_PEP_ID=MMETSP1101-20121128/1825_1 /TAXON_ID=46948 /ORGANISM="Rhodomonas abbreviata, Strain Caron Lab Isolate" /LENGTH=154 /DNA_ID=CAMNT_0023395545 /DNA_START=14 /DNA_END=478 /DNA_ORIENTATION=-